MKSLIGHSLGRYNILEPLGEGGMAVVYKAYDTRLESEVAVKVIRTEKLSPETLQRALKRFEREAKSLAKLAHPNIVNVLDLGEYEGQPYLVMPCIPGGTLKQLLNGKPMDWQKAARLLIPIARALDYAHKRGIVHRDVKPSNILITESGEPMLTDFGVAKIIDEEATLDLTGTSATVGTPEYMAPEQATSKTTDHRVDIYALGIVFYEMIAGRKPFQGDTPLAVLFKQASEPLPKPNQFVAGIPDQVERILIKALAKKPENRYQSMSEFASVLEECSGRKSTDKRFSTPDSKEPFDPRSRINLPAIPRKAWIISVSVVLGISLIAILSKPLAALSVQIFSTSTPSSTATATKTLIPAPTNTPIFPIPATIGNSPEPLAVPEFRIGIGADGATLVYVPAGEFTMGSENGLPDEKPVHTVYLDAFWIDQTEVTNKQYAACVSVGVCTPPSKSRSSTRTSYYGNSEFNDFPVIYVGWDQANTYCSWAGSRLPTEAEWEKAARGTDARTYPWGNGIPDKTLLNYNGSIGETPRQVGSYESGKSPYGAYDMAGNVWEWVNDRYSEKYYQNSPTSNPLGSDVGESRVLRGGSWGSDINNVGSTLRYREGPSNASSGIGFRCARGITP